MHNSEILFCHPRFLEIGSQNSFLESKAIFEAGAKLINTVHNSCFLDFVFLKRPFIVLALHSLGFRIANMHLNLEVDL